MAANGWRHGIDLNRQLAERPQSLEFFQAVRLIEALSPRAAPVGEVSSQQDEPVRFLSAPDLRFPPSDVVALAPGGDGDPVRLTVSFLGLAGGAGPLPMPFTELLLERLRRRDRAMRAFLDIFNHRLIGLFYRAHATTHAGFAQVPPAASRRAHPLFAALGLGVPALRDRLGVADAALLPYAGLLAHRPRSAVALQRVLSSLFALPVRVRPFTGHWHRLGAAGVTRLAGRGRGLNAVLGRTAVLGTRAWIQDGRAEIVVGPVDKAAFDALLPPYPQHCALASVARLHAGPSLDLRLRLRLKGGELPALRLGRPPDGAPGARLGWTTWLGGRPQAGDDDQVVVRLNASAPVEG